MNKFFPVLIIIGAILAPNCKGIDQKGSLEIKSSNVNSLLSRSDNGRLLNIGVDIEKIVQCLLNNNLTLTNVSSNCDECNLLAILEILFTLCDNGQNDTVGDIIGCIDNELDKLLKIVLCEILGLPILSNCIDTFISGLVKSLLECKPNDCYTSVLEALLNVLRDGTKLQELIKAVLNVIVYVLECLDLNSLLNIISILGK